MKETAIEKFIEQLEKQGDSWENVSIGRIQISIKVEDYLELQRQAKEIEKQKTIDFAYEIADDLACDVLSKKAIEDRYNEFFKSE
jgi:hypothetical protein